MQGVFLQKALSNHGENGGRKTERARARLEAWRLIERGLRRDRRYSVRAWLFAYEMVGKAEELRRGG